MVEELALIRLPEHLIFFLKSCAKGGVLLEAQSGQTYIGPAKPYGSDVTGGLGLRV